MRTGVCLAMAIGLAAGCSGHDFPGLADALERQPAGLVDPAALDEGFVIEPYDWECNGIRRAELFRLDGRAGDHRWEEAVPAADDVAVVGDHVVSVGTDQDKVPPSAVALRVDDGRPVWQRFFAAQSAELVGTSEGQVVVHLRGEDPALDDATVLALDPASGAIVWEATVTAAASPMGMAADHVVMLEDERSWFTVGPDGRLGPPVDAPEQVLLAGDLVLQEAAGGLVAHDAATGTRRWTLADAFDATYTLLGRVTGISPMVLVVELDSRLRPDRRLLVIDPSSGAVRWRDDGVATSVLAGDQVLLDVRTGSDPEDPTRRTAVARSVSDGAERWRHANTSMGGYLVRVGDRALLSGGHPNQPQAHLDDALADLRTGDGLPGVTGYVPGTDGIGPSAVDATDASPAFVAVQEPDSAGVATVAAFDGTEVRWEDAGRRSVAALARAGDDVIVLRSDPSFGCA